MADAPTAAELEALMDLRVRERNLNEGLITAEQVETFLEALADDEDNADWVELPEIEASEGVRKSGRAEDIDEAEDELLTERI